MSRLEKVIVHYHLIFTEKRGIVDFFLRGYLLLLLAREIEDVVSIVCCGWWIE
jgi:hypothetical protein